MRIRPLITSLLVGASLIAAPTLATPTTSAAPSPTAEQVKVLDLLNGLAVKGRAPKTGYDRDLFGQSWTDDVAVDGGHNGCDTRIIHSTRPTLARLALVTVPESQQVVQLIERGTIGTSAEVLL